VLGGKEEAYKRNKIRKFIAVSSGTKADCQPQTSICTDRKNGLIENDRLKWKDEISIF
jgi:hypothetical protein